MLEKNSPQYMYAYTYGHMRMRVCVCARVHTKIHYRSGIKENLEARLLQDPLKEFLCLHHSVLVFILKECLIIPETQVSV